MVIAIDYRRNAAGFQSANDVLFVTSAFEHLLRAKDSHVEKVARFLEEPMCGTWATPVLANCLSHIVVGLDHQQFLPPSYSRFVVGEFRD
jgi:hypothetical protein